MIATRLSARLPQLRSIQLTVLLAVPLLVGATATMAARVDFSRANDYYSALGTGELKVVEQYHLGPCERRVRERDYLRAYNECNFILKIFPNHPQALLLMAQACEQWKSPRCMLGDFFQNAVSINPQVAATYVVQGIHWHRTQQYARAISSYNQALELDPSLMNAHYNLALTYIETKQYDLANEHAQRAYELGATLPGLRDLLTKAGHWNTAQRASEGTASPKSPASATTASPADAARTK